MNDMRRTILWVVFTMSLVLLWDGWNKHNGKPTLFGAPVPALAGAASAPAAGSGVPAAAGALAVAGVATPASTVAGPAVSQKFSVSTDLFKVTLDTKGGDIARLELLKFPNASDKPEDSAPVVLMDDSAERQYRAQTGFIPQQGQASLPTHLTVLTAVAGERSLAEGRDEFAVRFESPEVGGVKLVKTYTFRRGDYSIGVKHELVNLSGAVVQPQIYLQLLRDGNPPPGESSFYSTFTGPALYTDAKKFQKVEFKDIEKRGPQDKPGHETQTGSGWVAMVQHYFTSAWLISGETAREVRTAKVGTNLYSISLLQSLGEVAPGASKVHEAKLYAGPQEENKLAELAPGLELVKDYGILHILAKPLFWVLDQLHKLLGNWGWSIVGLVVLLKIAFYGLNASAYKSMAKMKAVNPRIMELRERMKDKPQEMQQEMMRIYREEKVNPLGGCLPIFVQMPFFISLYWVLLASVEMRGAPWLGWIHDLSVADPFFILPTLMMASSLLQVWLGPKAGDEMQQKMMWVMPVMFGFMFFFFPAGLVLYWLVNNLLSIAQQYAINKRLGVA